MSDHNNKNNYNNNNNNKMMIGMNTHPYSPLSVSIKCLCMSLRILIYLLSMLYGLSFRFLHFTVTVHFTASFLFLSVTDSDCPQDE